MSNALYPKWKEQIEKFTANNDLNSGVVKAALIDTGSYTYSSAHQFYSELSGVIGTPQKILNKTFINGVFDGDNVTFHTVTGDSAEAIVIYIDTGSSATSPLVAFIDTGVTGLPITPNGGGIQIRWHVSGIFAL